MLQSKLMEVVEFLDPLLPLVNCHTVDFITSHLWDCLVPVLIREYAESTDIESVFGIFKEFQTNPSLCKSQPSEFLKYILDANKASLSNFTDITLSYKKLQEKLTFLSSGTHDNIQLNQFMSTKKTHEVDVMSDVVASLARTCQVTHVVDVGSGKGYLSSMLALHHRLSVLGIDSSQSNNHGAAQRSMKLQQAWKDSGRNVPSEKQPNSNISKQDTTYKQATEFVTEDTHLIKLVKEKFPESPHCEKVILVGLHTCGNLAPTSLRLFINNAKVIGLCNVGCCYHLIREEFSKNPFLVEPDTKEDLGFPMSEFLRSKRFCLGRNARMLASQSLERIIASPAQYQISVESLHFRALLQVLLVEKLGSDLPQLNVGRLAAKCSSFGDYVQKALKKLKVSDLKVSEEEIKNLYEKHKIDRYRFQVFHLMRLVMAPVIEGIILLDRLLYLREQGITEAFLVRLFDARVSPRCSGIIAMK